MIDTLDAIEAECKVPRPVAPNLFRDRFTDALRQVAVKVQTEFVLPQRTTPNLLANIDHYIESIGCADLRHSRVGQPAFCFAAGPSFADAMKWAHWFPLLRDRAALIAVQTCIRPLLKHGVRPHYVTALDYSALSARFYEGLGDMAGIDLVAMPQVHPTVPDAWPGRIRMTSDAWLNVLLGENAPNHGWTGSGSTVAHMSYALARFMGCDPVVLVGQDLAFTDGQYYHAGAAIHDAWAGEVNAFNTVEMMEHRRVMDHGPALVDCGGVYTEPVMDSYHAEFVRLVNDDAARGLTTLNVSGGRAIEGAVAVDLERVLLGVMR